MMKKIFFAVFSVLIMYSCTNENTGRMYVKGNIKGLKKGTLYLQKQIDSLIVSVDSISVNGTSEFLLTDLIESPEMYYLALDRSDKKIPFFGERDSIEITTRLDKFVYKAKISGSVNQDLLDKYTEIKKKFVDQNLELIKEEFEARKYGQDSVLKVIKKSESLLRRKYLYTVNFAVNNASHEVAPYIALTELANANIKLLDTINKSLSADVKKSKYGKQFDQYITELKSVKNN